jgi:hypothetical protein
MDRVDKQPLTSSRLAVLAGGGWLMVLPATLFLAAAAIRQAGGRGLPARLSGLLTAWAAAQVSGLGAALLFVVLPATVVGLGGATLRRAWREDPVLRRDTMAALAIVERHGTIASLMTTTLLAGAILTAAIAHVITD